jgi:hypothetical protein
MFGNWVSLPVSSLLDLVSKSQEILFARQLRDLPGFRQYFYSLYA